VLVLGPGKVVLSVHVSPVNVSGKLFVGESFPCVRGNLLRSILEFSLFNTAGSSVDVEEAFSRLGSLSDVLVALENWLWEGVYSVIVFRVVLFSISGLVLDCISPSVLGSGPGAVRLNGDVVGSTANAESSVFSPVSAP